MGMSTESMGILFAGISSILATLIYFTKNIKKSSCCGNDCQQVVVDSRGDAIRSTIASIDCLEQAHQTFPQSAVI